MHCTCTRTHCTRLRLRLRQSVCVLYSMYSTCPWRSRASRLPLPLAVLVLVARRDSVLITLFDAGTSILGGFAIFAVIGHLAHSVGTSVEQVVQAGAGPGLAFIAYPAGALLSHTNRIQVHQSTLALIVLLFFLLVYFL